MPLKCGQKNYEIQNSRSFVITTVKNIICKNNIYSDELKYNYVNCCDLAIEVHSCLIFCMTDIRLCYQIFEQETTDNLGRINLTTGYLLVLIRKIYLYLIICYLELRECCDQLNIK